MKKNYWLTLAALGTLLSTSNVFAHCDSDRIRITTTELFMTLTTTTVLPPVGTTTTIVCVLSDDDDLNRYFIEREATMVIEEGQIFTPSFLGAYAEKQGKSDLRAVARDVLKNGVQG